MNFLSKDNNQSDDAKVKKITVVLQTFVSKMVEKDFEDPVTKILRKQPLSKLSRMTDYHTFSLFIDEAVKEVEKMKNSKKVAIKKATNAWACGNNHKIVYYRAGFKKLDKTFVDELGLA